MSEFDDSIAIVGMSGQFPGAKDLDQFWENLLVGQVSATRFTDKQLREQGVAAERLENPNYVKVAYLLDDYDKFDAKFFDINPREAEFIDPQQRLFLETAWSALEQAGCTIPDKDMQVGVFAGASLSGYFVSHFADGWAERDLTTGMQIQIGNDKDYICTRTSYKLDLRGPSVNVQAACSTSLVAVCQAFDSLMNYQCDVALAGGVTVRIPHEVGYMYDEGGIFSPDGFCRSFDEAANGTVFGSGVGVVALKRLGDAINDGDYIHAVIKGAAVNNDGLVKIGFTAPSARGQAEVIATAQGIADVDPETIGYAEAHGTGTNLGDPIEISALTEVFRDRTERSGYCAIGSVKSNIGHLEAAAGIASFIKATMTLDKGVIPPSPHFKSPNPKIDFENSPFYVNTTPLEWKCQDNPRRACVSSFGIGGTNSHIIMEQAPELKRETIAPRSAELLVLSAKTEAALKAQVTRYRNYLQTHPDLRLDDICYTASVARSHFKYRISIPATDLNQLIEKLQALETDTISSGVYRASVDENKTAKLAFLCTGQGSQYAGMGQHLYNTEVVFRDVLDRCNSALKNEWKNSLLEIIFEPNKTSELDQTGYTQPALYALEAGLAALWRSWGIEPEVVLGHSVGEYAAAHIAGVFSLEDGLKLIAARARLMQALPAGGEMLAVMASAEKVEPLLEKDKVQVSLAVVNGPDSVVISGVSSIVQKTNQQLKDQGIRTTQLKVSHAFHSPLMAPMIEEFENIAKSIKYHRPVMPIVSNVSGMLAGDEIATAKYWVDHILAPVEFYKGMQNLSTIGINCLLEIGPKPILLGLAQACVNIQSKACVASLNGMQNDRELMLTNLGSLYSQGVNINWKSQYKDRGCRKILLPTYAFQRKRYWVNRKDMGQSTSPSKYAVTTSATQHPLVGHRVYIAGSNSLVFENLLDCYQLKYLQDHRVFDQVLFPGTAYVEMAFSAGKYIEKFSSLSNVLLQQPLLISEDGGTTVQCVLTPLDDGGYQFEVFSLVSGLSEEMPEWISHMSGKLLTEGNDNQQESNNKKSALNLSELKTSCKTEVSVDDYYSQFEQRGIVYGSTFRTIKNLWKGKLQALAEICLPESLMVSNNDYKVHPAILDACLQVFGAALPDEKKNETYLPFGIDSVDITGTAGTTVFVYAQAMPVAGDDITLRGNLIVTSSDGEVIVEINGLTLARANRSAFSKLNPSQLKRWLYEVDWIKQRQSGKSLAADFFVPPAILERNIGPIFKKIITEHKLDDYLPLYEKLTQLCIDYIVVAFKQLGFEFESGRQFKIDDLAEQLHIATEHKRQFKRLISMLAENKIIAAMDDGWIVKNPPSENNLNIDVTNLKEQYPALDAQISLLIDCGLATSAILKGEIDPLNIIFPEADTSRATRFYSEAPATQAMNETVCNTIEQAIANIPAGRKLRVLEIGAGTGGTTAFVLPRLPAGKVEYTYSDISPAFFNNAKQRFSEFDFVEFKTLNIEQSPFEQGYVQQEFDLVIAANVLHATYNLTETMAHVNQLLSPDGMIVLFEGTRPQYLVDLIFGWTDGWWRFEDYELRESHPLISLQQWKGVLQKVGFPDVIAFPPIDKPEADIHHLGVIVGRNISVANDPVTDKGTWLILGDNGKTTTQLMGFLQAQGEACIRVMAGNKFNYNNINTVELDISSDADFGLLADLIKEQWPIVKGVVNLWSLNVNGSGSEDGTELILASERGWGSALHLIKILGAEEGVTPPRLWIITRGAQPVDNKNDFTGLLQSPVLGVSKVIALEYPELQATCIDLDPQQPKAESNMLAQEIWSRNKETQVSFRGEQRFAARLVRSDSHKKSSTDIAKAERSCRVDIHDLSTEPSIQLNAQATYLITGGLGGIGRTVARWMVERGAKRIILVGRRAADETVEAELNELRSQGTDIIVAQADISNAIQLAKVLDDTADTDYPLRGIIQSAGLLDDALLEQQNRQRFINVLSPKMAGAWNLHQLTLDCELDLFVVFSSVASLFGAPGQANHSAANAFLDALVHYRRSEGLAAMGINWGAWAKVGSATHVTESNSLFKGVDSMEPEEAIWAMEHLMINDVVQAGVLPIDWSQLAGQNINMPLLTGLLQESSLARVAPGSFLKNLQDTPVEDRKELLTAFVRSQLANVLGLDASVTIDIRQGLFDLGLDSLTSVEFRNRIQLALGCTLASTLAFNYPSVGAVVMYLRQSVLELEIPDKEEEHLGAEVVVDAEALADEQFEDELDNLSEQDLAKMLEDELSQLNQDD
ncbi:Polyketide synthase modules and related proteins [hydrothermal vent metagenome]|uniref:Polyketide synthase modules and related proteins n=1 Tax=hydrothermal vent metagenome TaxID=652676 RepID=A0A3B1ARX5_9ZZZZ